MPEYDNAENKLLIQAIQDKITNFNDLTKWKSKLSLLLDVSDFERNEDGTIILNQQEQRIAKMIPPMDRQTESTISNDRRNQLWEEYKSKAEELLL